jgi:hypothetical protein
MRTTTSVGAGLLALALSACQGTEERDPYLDGIPDAEGLALELQGGAAEGLALAAKPAGAAAVAEAAATPVVNDDLAAAREKLRALNEAVRAVFARVAEVAAAGGRELPGGAKVYGPADRCVEPGEGGACLASANLRLTVRRLEPNLFAFALEARPVGATLEADFALVLAGHLRRAEIARRGQGRLWVSFPSLRAAAGDGFRGQGFLAAGFASGPVARSATYRMLGFTRDPAVHPPVTGAFTGFRTPAGVTRVRVVGLADLDPAGTDLELGIGRVVVHPSLGARAYGVVADWLDLGADPPAPRGDVPAGQYWFSRACYGPGQPLPAYKEWFLCPLAQGPVACLVAQGGTWADAVGQQVAGDPGDTWASTCALDPEPPELLPPPGPPGDGPHDAGPEEGHGRTGLSPDPCPADPTAPEPFPPAG